MFQFFQILILFACFIEMFKLFNLPIFCFIFRAQMMTDHLITCVSFLFCCCCFYASPCDTVYTTWLDTIQTVLPTQYAYNVYVFKTSWRKVSGFLRVIRFPSSINLNWPPRYIWNLVESDVKDHKSNLVK